VFLPSASGRTASPTVHGQPPCPRSKSSSALLPSSKRQRSWLREDYQQPRRLKGTRQSRRSPECYLTEGFSHRQEIHILLSSQALITKKGARLERPRVLERALMVWSPFLKSVYPDIQARHTRSSVTSLTFTVGAY